MPYQITRYGPLGLLWPLSEHSARFQCNKEYMRGQETYIMIPGISMMMPRMLK